MGKPKSKGSKAALKRAKQKKQAAVHNYSLDELLGKAADLLDECQFELAEKFCQRALEMDNDHPIALEMCANLLLERGEVEKAQHCLGRAITVQPDSGFTKYLTAGQLFSGTDSRDLYSKAIEIMKVSLATSGDKEKSDNSDDANTSSDLKLQISSAYVAISELYMSDLCDLPEAQSEAEKHISLSIQSDPSNPEAWQAEASLRLVLGQFDAAKESIKRSLDLWLPGHIAFTETGEGQETNLSYNSRLGTVKLLLDLELLDEATKVCDGLLEEDDEVVAPWYLLGWLNYLREDQDYWGNVRHYLNRAKQVHVMSPTDDEEMIKHIEEILAEVGEEGETNDVKEDLTLAEDDHEKAEKIANILDQEGENLEPENMES